MPKIPSSQPIWADRCDPRLPQAALDFRLKHNPLLTTPEYFGALNITAWLYTDPKARTQGIHVACNVTIKQVIEAFGHAETPDADLGLHSEGIAAEWFRLRPHLRVQQIFTERIPCPKTCAPLLRHYYPNVPWYYYYDRRSFVGDNGQLILHAGRGLKTAYGI
ncbi:MAG: hypothetical protein SFV54_03775 [Bryobacteraceae bacterium]|nr:hypothetical protein [Bryobacteraceae bacterium]